MKTIELRSELALVLALCGALALVSAGTGTLYAQPFPGSPGPGWGGSPMSGLPGGPYWWMSHGWHGPHHHHPHRPMPGLLGNTAIGGTPRALMFNMSDNSYTEMPQMIQPTPLHGRVSPAESAVRAAPTVPTAPPVTTSAVVRPPLAVRIVPENPGQMQVAGD